MKMHEIILDSLKYPLSGLKQFFSLGIVLLISSFLLSNYFDYDEYFGDSLGDMGLLIFILLVFLILIIATLFESGYSFKVIEKTLLGIENPPKMNKLSSMFRHGLNEIIIGILYFIVPLFLILALIDDIFDEINLGMPTLPDDIILLIIIVLFVLGFIASVLFTVAIPHMAFKGGALKEAFRFLEIFKKIKQIGLKRLLVGYFIVILGVVVIGWPILKEIIESTNIIGFVLAELIIAPYILMFSARFTALIYRG
jgi:hypothetical protein